MGVFANTFNAIANAIKAKDGGGDMTPAQMAGRIAALDVPYYPRPWIGSGTHYWLHFNEGDDLSVQINFYITGTATVDFGDGTVMTKTAGNNTVDHIYASAGDYRIDVSGYDSINRMVLDQFIQIGSEKLIQFETDAVSLSGNGNANYCVLSSQRYMCTNLEYLNFTEAKSLSNYVLFFCNKLKSILSPKLETYNNAIANNVSCEKFEMPNTLTTLIEGNGFFNNSQTQMIRKVSLSNTLTSIQINAFLRNSFVEELTIPNSIISVNNDFLIGCSYLKRCVIPRSLTSLPGASLRSLTALTYLDLPDTWEGTNSNNALYGLSNAKTVVIRATTPPPLSGSQNFGAINSAVKFYVPQGCVPAYEAANLWSAFTGKFYELDADGNVPAS